MSKKRKPPQVVKSKIPMKRFHYYGTVNLNYVHMNFKPSEVQHIADTITQMILSDIYLAYMRDRQE